MPEYYRIAPEGRRNGKIFSGLICNGHYFAHEIEVFEDGLFSCQEMAELPCGRWVNLLDLAHFKTYIKSGWVAGYIPNGGVFSDFYLGQCRVVDGAWLDPQTLESRILKLLDEMNPERANLREFATETEYIEIALEDGGWYCTNDEGKRVLGVTRPIFFPTKEFHVWGYLAIYADGSIHKVLPEVDEPTGPYSLEEIRKSLDQGALAVSVPEGQRLLMLDLGDFSFSDAHWTSNPDDYCTELQDTINTMAGKKGLQQTCRELFEEYTRNPTAALRDKLQEAYEAIPIPQREYILQDMDTLDIPIRMALYGKEEIEYWPLYRAAQALGKDPPPLPEIPQPGE